MVISHSTQPAKPRASHVLLAAADESRLAVLRAALDVVDALGASDPDEARALVERARPGLLAVDASAPWAESLVSATAESETTILAVADAASFMELPRLVRAGADAILTLPADPRAVAAIRLAAIESHARRRESRLVAEAAHEQLLRFAEDFQESYRQERERRRQLDESFARLEDSYLHTVRSLAAAVEAKDATTGRHIERVAEAGLVLARAVDPELASRPHLGFGFLLHDLGKIGVPDAVLLKPGPLTLEESAVMRAHPIIGAQIVYGVEFLLPVSEVIRHHHERWDGRGYPDGLTGERIPKAARVFAVVDAADAMLHDRPYRKGLPLERVRAEIEQGAGSQFDPLVVDAFVTLLESGTYPFRVGPAESWAARPEGG